MTLTELLNRLGDVERDHDGALAHCPAHTDSHPSLKVSVSDAGKVMIKCRAGCATSKVMRSLGLTLADLAGATPDGSLPTVAAPAPPSRDALAQLADTVYGYADALAGDSPEAADALAYAEQAWGLSTREALRLGLGVATDLPGGTRVVVPLRGPDGDPVYYQARALDPDAAIRWYGPANPDGSQWGKCGMMPGTGDRSEVLITEGPGDALTAAGLGWDAIAVRGAALAANPDVHAIIRQLADGHTLIAAGDGDAAGAGFTRDLARGVGALPLEVPAGEDLSSWRARDGHGEAIAAAVDAAVAAPAPEQLTKRLEWDERKYALTELGAARYVRDYITARGSGVRYGHDCGWALLDGGTWSFVPGDAVRTYVQAVGDELADMARDAWAESDRTGETARAKRLHSFAMHAQSSRGIDAIMRELRAVKGVPVRMTDFDTHPDLLAVENGIIHLPTGELRPHDPELLLSKRVRYAYREDAKAERWQRFLREVFPGQDDMPAYMQRLVGYGITGRTDEQCFAVHWGHGANGKSVYLNVLQEVFAEFATATPFSTFERRASGGIPNDIAALRGSRLVMASEGEAGKPMAESVLKRVTGGDKVTARFMRAEFFTFTPEFLLQLATNAKPAFRGQDEGLWRRVKFIPWRRYFAPAEREPYLQRDLVRDDAEGILAWAVEGARLWYRDGLMDPTEIRSATEDYKGAANQLAGFLPGWLQPDEEAEPLELSEVFTLYRQWADEEGIRAHDQWQRRTLEAALDERGFSTHTTPDGAGVAVLGLRIARGRGKLGTVGSPIRQEEQQ